MRRFSAHPPHALGATEFYALPIALCCVMSGCEPSAVAESSEPHRQDSVVMEGAHTERGQVLAPPPDPPVSDDWGQALDMAERDSPLHPSLARSLRHAQHTSGGLPLLMGDDRRELAVPGLLNVPAALHAQGVDAPAHLRYMVETLDRGLTTLHALNVQSPTQEMRMFLSRLDHIAAFIMIETASTLGALNTPEPVTRLHVGARYLDSLVSAPPEVILSRFVPSHPYYHRLVAALARYRAIIAGEGFVTIDPKVLRLRPGRESPLLGMLRQRLAQEDSSVADGGEVWDEALTDALRRARSAYRLRPFRSARRQLDRKLLKALSVTAPERARAITLNLERWRKSPARFIDYGVLVNLPDYHGEVWERGERLSRFRVVIGKAGRRNGHMINATPTLASKIHTVVYNPWWTVPKRIIREELVVKAEAFEEQRAALAAHPVAGDMEAVQHADYWQTHDYVVKGDLSDPRTLRVRRKPGPGNALGKVKFIFENRWAVFLHDTPQKGKFRHRRRAFSHGCVRVHKPLALAELLIRRDGTWEQVERARVMRHYKPTSIRLKRPVDVALVYFTAQVEDSGRVSFLRDVYRRDREQLASR